MFDFEPACPKCGDTDLFITAFRAYETRIPLSQDGFATEDAMFMHTDEETVECGGCGHEFPSGGAVDAGAFEAGEED